MLFPQCFLSLPFILACELFVGYVNYPAWRNAGQGFDLSGMDSSNFLIGVYSVNGLQFAKVKYGLNRALEMLLVK